MPTLVEIGPSNASQGQHRRKDATEQIKNLTLASSADAVTAMHSGYCIGTRKAGDLGSTPSECQIFYLFRCVLSSMLSLRSVGRSNFKKGRHNLTTLIQETDILLTSC